MENRKHTKVKDINPLALVTKDINPLTSLKSFSAGTSESQTPDDSEPNEDEKKTLRSSESIT